jgi:hypothetical protein
LCPHTGVKPALLQTALTDRERVLGPEHPDTFAARNNLAGAHRQAGDFNTAIPLYQSTLADCTRVLGDDHPISKLVAANLGKAKTDAARR